MTALVWLAVMEPLVRTRLNSGAKRLYGAFVLGIFAGGVGLAVGAVVAHWASSAAIFSSFAIGAVVYVLGLRLFRNGLTVEDRDALVNAVFVGARPHITKLLRPITTAAA